MGVDGADNWSVVAWFGERRWDGKSLGGGFEKNIVMWFRRAARALFKLVTICDWCWGVIVIFCVEEAIFLLV
jgi:hypothetical protein